MPTLTDLLAWLHVGLALALTGLSIAFLVPPGSRPAARGLDISAALLAVACLPLASAGGWWVDMPSAKMLPLVGALAVALGGFGTGRPFGRLAALVLAAFFATLGLASLRHGGPFTGFLAVKSILLGLLLTLLPWQGAVRLRMGAVLLLLAAGAVLGALQDIPVP